MNSFLLVFNDGLGIPTDYADFLDSSPSIFNWLAFPNTIFIVSPLTVHQLSNSFMLRWPGRWFLITHIESVNTNGIQPNAIWDFINNPKSRTVGPNPLATLRPSLIPPTPGAALRNLLKPPEKK